MTPSSPSVRVGVDIGGTFTDVALELDGRLHAAKVLTDHAQPERAILEGIRQACSLAGVTPKAITQIIHGTTLATNALIERRGARTALITTRGFRDVIEMRTESRFEQYDLALALPPALIARADRYVVGGRLDAQGEELEPLDLEQLDRVIGLIREGGYQSVAVGLLHSYRNPCHERRIRDRVRAALPAVAVSISSEVSPQIREYERFNTVCANAYVKPLIAAYLERLSAALVSEGVSCPVHLIHSGGGLISLATAIEFPVRLLESGPAGGAIYAAHYASRYGIERALSFDMGGTTAKICLIEGGRPKSARSFEVARTYRFKKGSGMPISVPVIEMVEIGAGGGSIGQVDALRQIRVGPESAGSEPGPACYGRGGERPTVTDADLVLGRLDPERFAAGSLKLDIDAAAGALEREIAAPLGADRWQAAFGITEVVDENMASAARVHAVESGRELSGFTMIAYGGAAPLHAVRIADKLGVRRLLVPPGAGVGSAIGFLRAPFAFETLRSAVMRLSDFDVAAVGRLLDEMESEASAFVRDAGLREPPSRELRAYMRYSGQGWEIEVPLVAAEFHAAPLETLRAEFDSAYRGSFGHLVEGADVEVVSWALQLSEPGSPPDRVEPRMHCDDGVEPPAPFDRRQVFDAKRGVFVDCALYQRDQLAQGVAIAGPLIITEPETSTLVPPDYSVSLQRDGCLLIEHRQDEGVPA
ncbi:hydantoinase/oxoprolinase family protein [Halotalea alkalilenta]|uniref:Methylhydantoinase n=1 Tax=Halotalea alkalilenta TaxID=376489 RepID=A0A172YCF7_9GAMM|nr:hydantoinase/oxoprolinase family protein [Halotalea alkalilenta]ANF56792.1 methylhydantoinase [Halotalea alkalilenta]